MVSKRQQVGADQFPLLVADLFEAAGLLRRTGEALAREEGQSQARWQVLSVVSDPPLTVAQAARRLGISRQGVQRVVNELLDEGLVATADNPDHRSSPLVTLTPEGRTILERITLRASHFHADLAPALTPDELARTRANLRTLIAALHERQ